jgi:hypothetical protein
MRPLLGNGAVETCQWQTPGVCLGIFANDTCIYATDRKESYVLKKLQRGLSAIETWCERWNMKLNEGNTQAIYFSHTFRPLEAHLTLKGGTSPSSVMQNISV